MPSLPPITESEWLIMARLWAKYPQTASELADADLDGKQLTLATVRTMLRRLVAKKAVGFTVDEKNASLYYYRPLYCEQDCVRQERQHFLEHYYRNNVGELLADIVSDTDLPTEELARLKALIDKKMGE